MALTPQELPGYWLMLIAKMEANGPKAAANAMSKVFHNQLVGVELVRFSHGPGQRTSSPPGQPPAAVSGALRRSVRLYPATATGSYTAQSSVVPLIVYARIQEMGGTVVAKHTGKDGKPGYLRFAGAGGYHFARSVTLPPRPYMRPTHKRTVADGSLRSAAAKAVRGVLLG